MKERENFEIRSYMYFVKDNIEFLDPICGSVIFVHCFSQRLDTKVSFYLPDDALVDCIAFGVLGYNKSVISIFFFSPEHSRHRSWSDGLMPTSDLGAHEQ